MKKILSLGIAAGMLVSACAAYAYPTLAGPTGGLALPNTAVVAPGTFNVAADYADTSAAGQGIGDTVPVRVVYGLATGFELGAGYGFQKLGDENGNNWGVNLKYATPLKIAGFDLAAGAIYNQTEVEALGDVTIQATEFYLVGGTVLPLAGKSMNLSLGANWTEGKISDGIDAKASGIRGTAAVNAMFGDKLCAGLEYQTGKKGLDAKPLSSIYARYAVTPMIAAQVGYTNAGLNSIGDGVIGANTIGVDKHHLVAGLNFVFGK